MANWKITTGYSLAVGLMNTPGGSAEFSTVGVSISSTVNEQTRPTNVVYVAKWGNNTSGNGSRDRPLLTIAAAITLLGSNNGIIVLGTGVYREVVSAIPQKALHIVGDGVVLIDGTSFSGLVSNVVSGVSFNLIKFQNIASFSTSGISTQVIEAINCSFLDITSIRISGNLFRNNTFKNVNLISVETAGTNTGPFLTYPSFGKNHSNNTFVNVKNLRYTVATNIWSVNHYNIHKNCNIQYQGATYSDYNVYHNCNFRFNATVGTQPTLLPEDTVNGFPNSYVPTGWIGTSGVAVTGRPSTPAAIQAGQVAAGFGGVGFANSIVQTDYPTDPNFNNISLLDFTLKPTSPARNLAYEGTFVGAKSVGTPLKFRLVEGSGDWLNSTSSNLTILDDSATLTNSANTATIESNVVDLGKDKVLRAISMQGLLGDRNGEWVDSSTDLDSVTTASGSNLLIANQSYVVETGTITYNSVLYQVGQKFAVISGTLDYTPTGGGVVRRIIEAPNRVCYEMRISSISAVDCSAQSYFKYEFEVQPTVNRVGNIASGAITFGNGEITFNRTPANVFLVSARWIQIRLNVQNNNLV